MFSPLYVCLFVCWLVCSFESKITQKQRNVFHLMAEWVRKEPVTFVFFLPTFPQTFFLQKNTWTHMDGNVQVHWALQQTLWNTTDIYECGQVGADPNNNVCLVNVSGGFVRGAVGPWRSDSRVSSWFLLMTFSLINPRYLLRRIGHYSTALCAQYGQMFSWWITIPWHRSVILIHG